MVSVLAISLLLPLRQVHSVSLHFANKCLKHMLLTEILASDMCCSCEKSHFLFCPKCDISCFCTISFYQIIDYIKLYPLISTVENQEYFTCAGFGINASVSYINLLFNPS
jgi:hypothetical protein